MFYNILKSLRGKMTMSLWAQLVHTNNLTKWLQYLVDYCYIFGNCDKNVRAIHLAFGTFALFESLMVSIISSPYNIPL